MRFFFAVAAATALAAPAAAARFEMQLQPGQGQTVRMQDGIGTLDNHGEVASIRLIQSEERISRRASIGLMVLNRRDAPFNFGPENVTAALADGTPVPIISYDQLEREERRRQGRRRFAAILGAAAGSMRASNSGWSHGTATYNGSTTGTFGSTPFRSSSSGTATYSAYDQGQADAARRASDAEYRNLFDRMAARGAAAMVALRENIRTTTVDPGQMFGGAVMFELPPAARSSRANVPVTFTITIDGEVHRVQTVLVRE